MLYWWIRTFFFLNLIFQVKIKCHFWQIDKCQTQKNDPKKSIITTYIFKQQVLVLSHLLIQLFVFILQWFDLVLQRKLLLFVRFIATTTRCRFDKQLVGWTLKWVAWLFNKNIAFRFLSRKKKWLLRNLKFLCKDFDPFQ